MMKSGFTLIAPTTWQQVYADWEARERGFWDEYLKENGHASWGEWRKKYIEPLQLSNRTWHVYKIDQPEVTVPNVWAGAFKGWRKYYPKGVHAIQFKDLVKNPAVFENEKVQAVMTNFPQSTTMIGFTDGEKLVMFEGMHRATAIAIAAQNGESITGELRIAMTEFGPEEAELFTRTYTQED